MTFLEKEVFYLLKRCRKLLVKQWGENDGFIEKLDTTISHIKKDYEKLQ